jgi:hypothetical protein
MRQSHFNDNFSALLGPIINCFFACSNEEKNKPKQQRVGALVQSLWHSLCYINYEKINVFLENFSFDSSYLRSLPTRSYVISDMDRVEQNGLNAAIIKQVALTKSSLILKIQK